MDLEYLRNKYSNLIIIEFNIYDQAGLANWMAERVGRADELHTPAVSSVTTLGLVKARSDPPKLSNPCCKRLKRAARPLLARI